MLLIWALGLLYSWWTVEDLTEGLRPLGECFSWIMVKYAERKERIKEKAEARRSEAATMDFERAEGAGVNCPAAWSFFRLRGRGRNQVDVEQNADGITKSSEDEILRQNTSEKL